MTPARELFIDSLTLVLRGGRGGDGAISFRREKFIPRGGPDGGDGGDGGDIYLQASNHYSSLNHLRSINVLDAQDGESGRSKNRHGSKGEDCFLLVPPGTIARDEETNQLLGEVRKEGDLFLLAGGGKGGWGNRRLRSSTNQAPRDAKHGTSGEEFAIRLELKLIADVGIIGLPNAGKSTLLTQISNAHPEIAEYPFTTLAPHLGAVTYNDFSRFIAADIPGLIEGAHSGKGLGDQFLRHIERTQILVHLVDLADPESDPVSALEIIEHELQAYSRKLLRKPQIIVGNKIDLLASDAPRERLASYCTEQEAPFFAISAQTGEGVEELKLGIVALLTESHEKEPDRSPRRDL